jgi:hypothetical protein
MMRRRILRLLCLAALGLALFDNFADASGCDDSKGVAVACHTCSCGPHLTSQKAAEVVVVAPPTVSYQTYQAPTYDLLMSDSIFHPPCLAA